MVCGETIIKNYAIVFFILVISAWIMYMYSHLSHIITYSFSNSDDTASRRNKFVGQANCVVCLFTKLDAVTRLKLCRSYCCSM
jgi:hypothetical protein